jgi:succinate dehydrogenase/fumarate reductase flavoprotein subunit
VAGETAGGLRAPTRPGGNALAETLVFGRRAGDAAAREQAERTPARIDAAELERFLESLARPYGPRQGRRHLEIRREIQQIAERSLSVVRSGGGLKDARGRIAALLAELDAAARPEGYPSDFLSTRNLAVVAELLAATAERREETRGSHFRREYEGPRETQNRPLMVERAEGGLTVDWVRI